MENGSKVRFVSPSLSPKTRLNLLILLDLRLPSQIGASEWILKGGEPSERDVPMAEKVFESESTSVEEIHA